MRHLPLPRSRATRLATGTALAALVLGLTPTYAAAVTLDVDDASRPGAPNAFRDWTRDGSARTLRDDLSGALAGEVEFVQATAVAPTGNDAAERPDVTAERTALLLFSPRKATTSLTVEVRVAGQVVGTLDLAHPTALPAYDQATDTRGAVTYSSRAWSAQLPWQWVRPGLQLTFTDAAGTTGSVDKVDIDAPHELVINNIQLGMLTDAPDNDNHRFIKDPANGATDYFQTIPISKLVMAQYDKVELDRAIVASGRIYTAPETSDGEGGVYAGDLRENVGKAQVSTGVNLATFGISSAPMTQRQPGLTNQRVIHHSAGAYTNGRQEHALSGGNGMATLGASVGNELSHELGHSYGLGHFPGTDLTKTGDDRVRMASHHMDSGWGWIAHRDLMRSNLKTIAYEEVADVNGDPFRENLLGKFNFNRDTMSGGSPASLASSYTHMTAYSLKRAQDFLSDLVADPSYPSGYRAWDADKGTWVDGKLIRTDLDTPKPTRAGVPVFTFLGGYNPAKPEQSLLYDAFRSNYGVTLDLPTSDPSATSADRSCWLQVDFAGKASKHFTLDASDGVKQLQVNVAIDDKPTGAQVSCRAAGVTTHLGDAVSVPQNLPALPAATVVGQEAGFEELRAQELAALDPVLVALAGSATPVLGTADMIALRGWSDDLSALSAGARKVADRILAAEQDATDLVAWLDQQADTLGSDDSQGARDTLVSWLQERGTHSADALLPAGAQVTVDNGKCLTLGTDASGEPYPHVTPTAAGCTGGRTEDWFVDALGRIHPATRADLCLRSGTPTTLTSCSLNDPEQQWGFEDNGYVAPSTSAVYVLDLNRSTGRPVLYWRSGTPNQIWKGLEKSPNPLLAQLDGTGLAALWEAWGPTLTIDAPKAGATGWHTSATKVATTANDAFFDLPLTHEIKVGARAWTTYDGPVTLGDGTTTVGVRATTTNGVTDSTHLTVKQDTVAPVSSATVDTAHLLLAATDATSGVARVEYRIGDGEWTEWTGPVPSPGRDVELSHRAVDKAGNVSEALAYDHSSTPVTLTMTTQKSTYGTRGTLSVAVEGITGEAPEGSVTVDLPQASPVASLTAPVIDGVATVRLPKRLPVGQHSLRVTHAGDARYAPTTALAKARVVKADTTLKVKLRNPIKARSTVPVKVRARVRTEPGVALSGNVRIVVKRAGKRVALHKARLETTKRRGVVRFTLPKRVRNRPGTYTVRVAFRKSPTSKKAVSTTRLVVR